ncbi:glycosyltransferase family 1 protein [Neobacillus soli]|uniref:glycosyltransferase family 1 protein n=1 Tax=Neobacillus soli TaxID=220688 RepID=UPI000826E997|nr:glycosyltransferase family 1 protein [Neobacillus soli]
MNKEPKRILHIVSSMERGGAETLIMNVYRNLDRSKIQFDFITHSIQKGDYEDEISELGGKIFKIASLGQLGPFLYLKELMKIMKSNVFVAVHSHTDYQSGFPALAAKLCGIKKRICHSHSTNWQKGYSQKEKITLTILRSIIRVGATDYCSCSEEAAQFLFGNRKVNILKNGIDLNQFVRNKTSDRKSVMEELKLPESVKIIGHVGRFSESKNHIFLLKVLKKLVDQDNRYVALLIGDGPLRTQIEKEAEMLGILNQIRFLGVRADISRLMNAFDVFLFPSKFEGFGIVTIEAQCSGTPCVISDTVPKTTDMGLGLASFVSLNACFEDWCTNIKEALSMERPASNMILKEISKRGYNIQSNVNDWIELYVVSG